MGIISDIYEDNRARNADDANLFLFLPINRPLPASQPEPYTCPLCSIRLEERRFNQHLLRQHASKYAYLRIDGHVIRDGVPVKLSGNMQECQLVVLGIPEADAALWLDGETVHHLRVCESLSLLPYIPRDFAGEIRICVHLEHQHRVFIVHYGPPPRFDPDAIDRGVADLQRALDTGTEPNWEGYRRRWIDSDETSELEKRYARGYYTYSLAMWLDNRQEMARSQQHLEEAFTLLSPFDTPLARTALGILAIRMNVFDYLRQWKPFSRLRLACAFFVERDLAPRPVQLGPFRSTLDEGIYADTFTETYLDALLAFYANDADALDRRLVALARHTSRGEPHNEIKYALLQARALTRAGRLREARPFYEYLVSNPIFGDEAQEHLL